MSCGNIFQGSEGWVFGVEREEGRKEGRRDGEDVWASLYRGSWGSSFR